MPILPESFRVFLRSKAPAALLAVLAFFFLATPPAQAGNLEEALAAAQRGNADALSKFLKSGAVSPNAEDKDGNSLLILAARDGHVEAVEAVLRFRPKVDYRNRTGDSALMLAASQGDMKLLDLLLANGAKTNPPGDKNAWTALHYAALEGKLPIVERLLAVGADINALTPNLSNALMLAARNGHIDIVRRLLQTPIDLNRRNDRGLTADEWALSKGNTKIADLIVEARTARARR
ncbi:MAG: ankyrin repeat domain-containing protein [Proteobacteria bacterium]|jgi:ankyrin repeat protein|nr:ankyrin repeat domain-containing protein [Pseudomonadota bacterium]